ncbi:hypothetical protein QQF64_003085 [Cirrhinus molitorella]|uniref:Uncharacterized protein n=1 Tax=Cirrhinus molitorella TaxID=172907 RepID=A0ABR3MJ42_9TELE
MEELKQTMRDVGRHMLNDPPSGAQRSRLGFLSPLLTHTQLVHSIMWTPITRPSAPGAGGATETHGFPHFCIHHIKSLTQ